jgi:hypothetical protein
MPEHPWTEATPVKAFEPLVALIDQNTQSNLFRRAGDKYSKNGDYYDIAKELDDQDQATGKRAFENGVTVDMQQSDGWPTRLVIEDKAAGLTETVTLNEQAHTIETDKVEYCGVSRSRKFSTGGEYFRAYNFEGGSIEKSGPLPVLKLDQ